MKCRGKARGIKGHQGYRALAGANQIGNTTGTDDAEEHAAEDLRVGAQVHATQLIPHVCRNSVGMLKATR
jgi:hypothetical protein